MDRSSYKALFLQKRVFPAVDIAICKFCLQKKKVFILRIWDDVTSRPFKTEDDYTFKTK